MLWRPALRVVLPAEGRLCQCAACVRYAPAPGEAGELLEVNAGLRAANARLRELLAAKDAQIEALTGQLEELRAQVADLAAQAR